MWNNEEKIIYEHVHFSNELVTMFFHQYIYKALFKTFL